MKNILQYILVLTMVVHVQAQDFQGTATYESKTSMQDLHLLMGNDVTPEMKKMLEEKAKPVFEKTFVLKFNKSASTYEEEEKLEVQGQDVGFRMMLSFAAAGNQYKDTKNKRFLNEKEMFGKNFLVDDTLISISWKLENESRKIGDYTCYKATAVIPADVTNLMNMRPKKGVDYEKVEVSTNFTEVAEIPKDMVVTAWYTPEIPVSQGPVTYWGLPGLILEVSDDRTTILCSKLVLNPKEKSEIKPYSKGTRVTREEYAEIFRKKTLQLQEMWRRAGN